MIRFLLGLLPVLFLLGAAQGVFLALVLAGMKRGNRLANRFLICLLLVFSIGLVSAFLSATYAYRRFPFLIGIDWPLDFLYGPLLYFYVKALTEQSRLLTPGRLLAHALPAVFFFLYLVPLFLLDPATKSEAWFLENSYLKNYSPIVDPLLGVMILQIGGYLVLSLKILKRHAERIRQNFSSLAGINLIWLRNLIIAFSLLLGLFTFFALFSQFMGMYREAQMLFSLATALLIYGMGYRGIRQPEIFTTGETVAVSGGIVLERPQSNPPAGSEQSPPQGEQEAILKYRKSALTDEHASGILARLTELMEEKQPYLEMGLTLTMLANMIDESPHHVSQVINEKLQKSFFDFVNEYRVRETQKALASVDAERFSILGIALDAGFNSKSAFYTAFRKHTGLTPTQYKKRLEHSTPPAA